MFRPGLAGIHQLTKPLKLEIHLGDQVVRQNLRRQNQPSWEAKGAPPSMPPESRDY